MLITKICTKCKVEKPLTDYYTRTKGGKQYPRSECIPCNRAWRSVKGYKELNERRKQERANGVNRAYYVHQDTRSSDRKKGRDNDLDIEFIEKLISKPCAYCGNTEGGITLDRVDSRKGHTKDNVVQSCFRCNMIKGNMPNEAWMFLINAVKKAHRAGAFGEWGSRPLSKRNTCT